MGNISIQRSGSGPIPVCRGVDDADMCSMTPGPPLFGSVEHLPFPPAGLLWAGDSRKSTSQMSRLPYQSQGIK